MSGKQEEIMELLQNVYSSLQSFVNQFIMFLSFWGDRYFGLATKNVMISGWTAVAVSVVLIIVAIVCWIMLYKYLKDHFDDWYVVPVVLTIIFTIIIFLSLISYVPPMFNPEYDAMKDCINMISYLR